MLSCVGQGAELKKTMRKRAASIEGPIMPTITNTPTYIYLTTTYVPMTCEVMNDFHFQFCCQAIKSCFFFVSYSFPLKEFEIHSVNAKTR
jgi:hypothetical protein